jgi:hypothetical protein
VFFVQIFVFRSEIRRHVFTLGPDVEHDQARDHIDNPTGHEKRIDDQKYRVYDGCSSVGGLWEQEIEYGFAKEDDHQADSYSRPVQILLRIDHTYRFQADQWIEQPCNTDPDKHRKGDSRGFSRIHRSLSYKKQRRNKNFFAIYF